MRRRTGVREKRRLRGGARRRNSSLFDPRECAWPGMGGECAGVPRRGLVMRGRRGTRDLGEQNASRWSSRNREEARRRVILQSDDTTRATFVVTQLWQIVLAPPPLLPCNQNHFPRHRDYPTPLVSGNGPHMCTAATPLSMRISPTPTNPAPAFPQFRQLFIMIQYGSSFSSLKPHPISFVACWPRPGSETFATR